MSSHPFDILDLTSGALIFTPCPGIKEASIEEALTTLKKAGAKTIITVMPDEEMAANGVESLSQVSNALPENTAKLLVRNTSRSDYEQIQAVTCA